MPTYIDADIERIEDSGDTIGTTMRNKQTSFENDGDYTMVHKYANGTYKYWYNTDKIATLYSPIVHKHALLYDYSLSAVLLSATTYNNINIGGGATGLSEGKLTVVSNNLQSPSLVLADSQSYSATTRGTDLQFWGKYTSGGNTIQFASIKGKKENATINDFSGMLQFSTRTNTSAITDRFTINGNGDMMFGNFSDFKHQTQTDFTRLQYGKLFSMVYSKNDDVSWIGGMVFMKNLYQTPAYGYDKFIQTGYAHKLIMDVNGYTFRITSGAKDADDTTSTPLGTFKFTQNRNFCVNTNEINAVSAGKVQIAVLSAVGGVTTSAYTTMGFVSTGTVTTSADKGISGVNGYIRIYDNGRTRYIPTYNVIPGS